MSRILAAVRVVTRARFALLAATFLAASFVVADPSVARVLRIKKPSADAALRESPGSRAVASPTPATSRPVRRLPLDLGRVTPVFDRRPHLERRPSARGAGADTLVLKVAMLRIDFGADRKGDQTTGDGRMMRGPATDDQFIDPPPHNEAYFKAHLTALNRFWSSMTYGNIAIEGDVFPKGQEFGAYTLSDMADYGPENENEFFSVEGLTNFVKDSLKGADADSGLVWNDYDVLFIVHAGADWQNDVIGNSPFDLPTFSISLSDSDVVVSDTGDTLTTTIVFPETSSQDGFLVALNGAIAHEMGHQLGLFDLYNVETFAPTVGFYDLMDSGNLASVLIGGPNSAPGEEKEVIGVLPTCPGAWSRWLVLFRFGIDPPLVKEDVPRARLRAIQSRATDAELPANGYKWARLPISDTEYFLVENRVDDLDGRDVDGNFNTALDQDDSTGVVLGPIVGSTEEISHNYDLLIDPGVLIWHIDERQVLANFAAGRGINVFYDKRAITIEEADGIVDIGSPFSEFPLGTDKETFHAGNNANFSPTTRPNSDSNLRSPSNISITSIGERDTTMAMDFSFSSKPRGWPMKIAPYGVAGKTSTTSADTDGDGRFEIAASGDSSVTLLRYDDGDGDGDVDFAGLWPQPSNGARTRGAPAFTQAIGNLDADLGLEIVSATDSGAVYVWNDDGTPFGTADSTGLLLDFSPGRVLANSPIPADLDRDGVDELYLTTADGELRGYNLSSGTPSALFTPRVLPTALPDSGEAIPSVLAFGDLDGDDFDDALAAFIDADSLFLQTFERDGRRPLRRAFALPAGSGARHVFVSLADFDRSEENNDLEILLATDRGFVLSLDRHGDPQPGWPVLLPPTIGGPPAFGDVDGDGLLEAAIASGENRVDVLNYNGTSIPGYPAFPRLADHPGGGGPRPGPAIADVNGDGMQDVVCGFVDFTVRALDAAGEGIEGFPLVTGGPVLSTPAILDANDDGRLDLFVQCTDGFVYGRILSGLASAENPAWGMFAAGPRLHGSFDERRLPARGGSDAGLLRGPVTIYPNPAFTNDAAISIRYTLDSALAPASDVEISLYNLAGELVERMSGTAFPNTENVAQVSTDRLASGTYLCTLRARSGDREASRVEKFAVIR